MTYDEYIKEKKILNTEYNGKFEAIKHEHHAKLKILRNMWEAARKPDVAKKVKAFKHNR